MRKRQTMDTVHKGKRSKKSAKPAMQPATTGSKSMDPGSVVRKGEFNRKGRGKK